MHWVSGHFYLKCAVVELVILHSTQWLGNPAYGANVTTVCNTSLRISYFGPGWNYYVRQGVSFFIFGKKEAMLLFSFKTRA